MPSRSAIAKKARDNTRTKTFRMVAEPTEEQAAYLRRCSAAYLAMYNEAVTFRRSAGRFSPKRPDSEWLSGLRDSFRFYSFDELNQRRRYGYEAVANKVLRGAEEGVDAAWTRTKRAWKDGEKASPPRRKRTKGRPPSFAQQIDSGQTPTSRYLRIDGGRYAYVKLPQPRDKRYVLADPWVKVRYHRDMPVSNALARMTWKYSLADHKWYCSLTITYPIHPDQLVRTPTVVGVDLGIAVNAAAYGYNTETGDVTVDRLFQQVVLCTCGCGRAPVRCKQDGVERQIVRLRRSLARQHRSNSPACFDERGVHFKGQIGEARCRWKRSGRAQRTERRLATLMARQARQRRETVELISHDLVYGSGQRGIPASDLIAFEDLKVAKMTKSAKGTAEKPGTNVRAKAKLNRAINAMNWGKVRQRTDQKAQFAAVEGRSAEAVKVPQQYTSQTCNECGHVHKDNRHSQDKFECQACGHRDNADRNAARNVATLALVQQRDEP